MLVRDLKSLPVRYRCSALPVSQRSWVQIPNRPYFSGLIFTTAEVVFTTAKVAFIFTYLSAVRLHDFHTFTFKALALLFVMWMVGGRVDPTE